MFDTVRDATNYVLMSKCAHMLSPICGGMSAEGKNLSGFLWVKKKNILHLVKLPSRGKTSFCIPTGIT